MDVLVVDPDSSFVRLLGDVLSSAGHTVIAATDGIGAVNAARSARPDVYVVGLRPAHEDGLDIVERVGAHIAPVTVLLVDDFGGAVTERASRLGVRHLLARPVSLLDLADLVQTLSAPTPRREVRPVHLANAAELARLWARRVTGVLTVERPPLSAWVLLSNGGPVGADALQVALAAIEGGALSLEPCPVDGVGDRDALGRGLWERTSAWVRERPLPDSSSLVVPGSHTSEARLLPVSAAVQGILRALDRPTSITTLAAVTGMDPSALLVDLSTLAALGFLGVQGGVPTSTRPPAPIDRFRDLTGIDLAPGRSAPPPPERRAHPPPPPPTRSGIQSVPGLVARSLSPETAPAAAPTRPPSRTEATPSLVSGVRSTASASGSSPLSGWRSGAPPLSGATSARPESTSTAHGGQGGLGSRSAVGETAMLLVRLHKELRQTERADPWTVLAIPRSAPRDLVERAVDRMTRRYAELARHPHHEVRDRGAILAGRVAEAAAYALEQTQPPEVPEAPALKAGLQALERGDWAAADTALSAARDLAPDSAEVMAHLGWARFHHPSMARDERQEDGLGLLELALQYDPTLVAGWWFLASARARAGLEGQARVALARLLKLAPRHVEGQALARRLGA